MNSPLKCRNSCPLGLTKATFLTSSGEVNWLFQEEAPPIAYPHLPKDSQLIISFNLSRYSLYAAWEIPNKVALLQCFTICFPRPNEDGELSSICASSDVFFFLNNIFFLFKISQSCGLSLAQNERVKTFSTGIFFLHSNRNNRHALVRGRDFPEKGNRR